MKKERKYIPRKQFKFWLVRDVQSDEWLMEIISYWKERRLFTEMLKNGIRLMWSLGQGHTDVLFALFPHLEAQIINAHTTPPTPDTGNLERKLERIEMLIEQRNGDGIDKNAPMVAAPPMKPLLKGMGGHTVVIPSFDDDAGDTIVLNRSTGSTSNSHNLMAGIFGLD